MREADIRFVLAAATRADGHEVYAMLQEIGPGENGFGNSAFGISETDFPSWLAARVDMAHGKGLQPGLVPMTTFWLLANGQPVGTSKLRHRLNEKLFQRGGHIGYCIRPSARGRGYGNHILRLTLAQGMTMGISRFLITCDESNVPSRKVIEWNGGVLEDIQDGGCRYWIDL